MKVSKLIDFFKGWVVGNFEPSLFKTDDFEVAVIDRKNGEFVTKFFKPELSDDVIGYMKKEDLEEFVNQIFKKGFQVG